MLVAVIFSLLCGPVSLQASPSDGLPKGAVRRLSGHSDAVKAVAYSPDGRFLVSASRDSTLVLWDARTGERIRVLKGHTGGVTSVAWRSDGKRILSGSQDRTLAIWDAESGERVRTLKGHTGWVRWVSYGPKGRRCFSGGLDRIISVWDAAEGTRLQYFVGDPLRMLSVVFSRDGRKALVGTEDKNIWVWGLDSEAKDLIERALLVDLASMAQESNDSDAREHEPRNAHGDVLFRHCSNLVKGFAVLSFSITNGKPHRQEHRSASGRRYDAR